MPRYGFTTRLFAQESGAHFQGHVAPDMVSLNMAIVRQGEK